jgi:transcriptional regulator with XRE-family HTH domain
VGEIERGVGNPTVDSVVQLAQAFGIDVAELFRRDAPELTYTPLSPDDFAVVREARQTLISLEDVMKRLDASAKPVRSKKRRAR